MTKQNHIFFYISMALLAVGFACIHMHHVSTLFENDRHFSHLSNLEREMTFRTEMGFYYYYYKVIVNAPTFRSGLETLLHDNQTEYPDVINALQRFNLYPEVFIGWLFRLFDTVTKYYDLPTKQCWEVNRGPSISPVNSCEGLGDPMYFYLEFVWYCAGLSNALLFLYASTLSDSLVGGLLTVLSFLYNHGHCTRVQWTPPLRESFAYPFCVMQMWSVTNSLKNSNSYNSRFKTCFQVTTVAFSTFLSLLLWQFSQFFIATQTIAVDMLYSVGVINKTKLLTILMSQMIGLLVAGGFQFGNELLFQSILFSLMFTSVFVVLHSRPQPRNSNFQSPLFLPLVFTLSFLLKNKLNSYWGEHDAHIFDILRSKITNFRNFHTMLYTCSPEFDFLPFSTIYELTITGLIPIVFFAIICIFCYWTKSFLFSNSKSLELSKIIDAEIAYNILQLAAFTIMAFFVMRLKLFWTPHLCVMASLVVSPKYFPAKSSLRYSLLITLIAVMSYHGIQNIIHQRNIMGEYVNIPFEEVLNWINSETLPTDVFAGPMSVMANVLLSTGRKIVNHPHYENHKMRDRTMRVYSIFSRQKPAQIYTTLLNMGVDYVVLEETWCFPRSRENCSMVDLWNFIDFENKNNEPVCPRLFAGNPEPFIRAFSNEVFVILSLKAKQFIEFTPLQQYQI